MNRNVLKIIAVLTMFIDHIGAYLLDNNIVLRIIGRIAFPIFAFFIAEGMKYTKNRKRYFLLIFIFAIISQVPYMLLKENFKLNVLFTFLISIIFILMIEKLKTNQFMQNALKSLTLILGLSLLLIACLICDLFALIDYSILGVMLVLSFYFFKSPTKFILSVIIIVLMVVKSIWISGFSFDSIYQIFAILSIVLLLFYNNKKGKLNLKYLFYLFYPAHLFFIWVLCLVL